LKFLVSGGAGFIGSELCRALLEAGHELFVYDNFARGRREYVPDGPRATVFEGDIRDAARVRDFVARVQPHYVVHLAALHYIPDCIARPDETRAINVDGTQHVLDACRASRELRGVAIASSAAVYAPIAEACQEETSPLGPCEVYGESKLECERLARAFYEQSGVSIASLRIFNAIGPRETNPHVVPHIFESLKRSDVIPLGNMSPRRDYIHTRDIASAIVAIAEKARGCSVYNVGSGKAHSVADLVEVLRAKLGRPIEARVDADRVRPVDRELLLASVSKIQAEIGWAPRVSFDEALEELIDDYGLRKTS